MAAARTSANLLKAWAGRQLSGSAPRFGAAAALGRRARASNWFSQESPQRTFFSWDRSSPSASSSASCAAHLDESESPPEQRRRSSDTRRQYVEFQRTLQDPDDIWILGSEARKKFNLTIDDLKELGENYILKESPYEADQEPFRQYALKDVVALALRKYGEQSLLEHFYNRYLIRQVAEDVDVSRKLYGHQFHSEEECDLPATPLRAGNPPGGTAGKIGQKSYWYNAPSTTTPEGWQSVMQGLRTNSLICAAKGSVWYMTGSHVVFADWMHSIADVANYSYRLMELNRSARHRDVAHPYGYAPLRYITADRSFVFLGFVGGVCPLIHGFAELLHAHQGAVQLGDHLAAPALVFLICGMLEGAAVKAAYLEILGQAKREQVGTRGRGVLAGLQQVRRYLKEGRDVMSTATFTEATSGVLGAGVGLVGLGLSWQLQSAVPDIAASILMASMVCGVSQFLLRKSGNALLGQTLPRWRVKALVEQLEAHAAVVNVYDVKTEMVGTDTVRFKAEVQFNPQAVTERILGRRSKSPEETRTSSSDGELARWQGRDPQLAHAILSQRLRDILPQLQNGVLTLDLPGRAEAIAMSQNAKAREHDATAAWLYRNNGLFYEALAWELKDVERVIRAELGDFKNVHIDLEPW